MEKDRWMDSQRDKELRALYLDLQEKGASDFRWRDKYEVQPAVTHSWLVIYQNNFSEIALQRPTSLLLNHPPTHSVLLKRNTKHFCCAGPKSNIMLELHRETEKTCCCVYEKRTRFLEVGDVFFTKYSAHLGP